MAPAKPKPNEPITMDALPAGTVVELQGKQYPTHAGLLALAHAHGMTSMITDVLSYQDGEAVVKATVEGTLLAPCYAWRKPAARTARSALTWDWAPQRRKKCPQRPSRAPATADTHPRRKTSHHGRQTPTQAPLMHIFESEILCGR